jgi:hypothetical protein
MLHHGKILRTAWTFILALLISCVLGSVVLAGAEESETVGPPQAEEPKQEERSFKETIVDIEKSVEETHEQLEQGILDQVIRLDDFFGTAQTETRRRTSYEFRWRSGIRVERGKSLKLKPDITLRASLVLPRTSEKLRLFISGENQIETLSPALPQDPGNPGFDRTAQPAARIVNTEFRYRLIEEPDRNLFIGAGVRIVLPLEPFVRGRFQITHNFSKIFLIRVGETLFVKPKEIIGETTEVSLERLLDEKTIVRLAGTGTLSQGFHGMEWGSELSWIRELSAKSAITFTGGIYGSSTPSTIANNYRLLTRYRQNFLAEWLFYELEPEISWPRDSDGAHSTKYAMTFRLEVLFNKADEKN